MPSPNSEADAIRSAYEDRVKQLFTQFIVNIGDEPVTHDSDQINVSKFVKGLSTAKRARELALNSIGEVQTASASASTKKNKPKQRAK